MVGENAQLDRRARLLSGILLVVALATLAAAWALAARGSAWWAVALRSALSVRCGLILLAGAAALAVIGRAMSALGRPVRRPMGADQRGVAMLEFALLFPIAMTIVLTMVQSAMLMTGNLMVHYGAYCAARSAITWVPKDLTPDEHGVWEPRNVVRPEGESFKRQQITAAAVLGVLPTAGRPGDVESGYAVRNVAARVHEAFNRRPFPARWDRLLGLRYTYAANSRHTWVELSEPTWEPDDTIDDAADGRLDGRYDNQTGLAAYGETEDIRVTVHHQFYLSTPYVNAIFGDEIVGNPGHYATEIVAGYTLVNQGRYDTIVLEYDTVGGRENEFLLPH